MLYMTELTISSNQELCNYVNHCTAQFPEGIITNYEEGKIIWHNMECSHMMPHHNQAGYVMYITSRNSVHDNQGIEIYIQWYLSSFSDFRTDKRITFDEFIAEQGILSFEPKTLASTMIVVDRYGLANIMMCKINQTSQDFLLDQFKHYYPEAVITIERNSIGIQPSSSHAVQFCPSLSHDRTTNSNNVLKAGIIQKMLSIKRNFSIDKIKFDVMRVAVSVQECVKIDQASNEL